ncbi:hypothetical protein ACQKM9_21570 [Viridibacillus sp. NPDC093762]|uniref:hypothetical protein n=1 Tax=Viridibacillus sp. NPDC093762 TaxID=3390720 RepID=UPI003CFC5526
MKKKMGIFLIVSLVFCFAPLFAFAADVNTTTDIDATIEPFTASYFEMADQNVTGYTASKYKADGSLRYTANNVLPGPGIVAMKKKTIDSEVPYGSIVKAPKYITNYDGSSLDSYFVQDTGVGSGVTDFAIDIWWGFCRTTAYNNSETRLGCSSNDASYQSALAWGAPKMKLGFYIK